jgi:Na+/alanine symporter
MNWKKSIAKEWVWLLCTVLGVFLILVLGSVVVGGLKRIFVSPESVVTGAITVYLIRLTAWSIKQISKK